MGANTKIEWTATTLADGTMIPGHTFNPWVGCTKVSDGCKHCYAEALMDTHYKKVIWGPTGTRNRTSAENWKLPLRWDKAAKASGVRAKVFCASLADVFEGPDTCRGTEAWETIFRARVDLWQLIEATPNLDWLLLTKRPENIRRMVPMTWIVRDAWPANVWVGTSVENQKTADERIPHLLRVPAPVKFLSCEPLLEKVELWRLCEDSCALRGPGIIQSGGVTPSTPDSPPEGYDDSYPGVDWVIVGGESGGGARPCRIDWVRSLVKQCKLAAVPVFVKQLGAVPIIAREVWRDMYPTSPMLRIPSKTEREYLETDHRGYEILKMSDKGGDWSQWPEYLRVREFPESPVETAKKIAEAFN